MPHYIYARCADGRAAQTAVQLRQMHTPSQVLMTLLGCCLAPSLCAVAAGFVALQQHTAFRAS